MKWIELESEQQLSDIVLSSSHTPQVIFKHSTRCSISSMVMKRLERSGQSVDIPVYYLDLLSYRPISAKIEETFAVQHESPQILVIQNGKCTYTESHTAIDFDEILANTKAN